MADPNKTRQVTDERTINTGTTLNVIFGVIKVATNAIISNYSTVYDITCDLNDNGQWRTIQPGKSLILNNEYITSIKIANASGGSVEFGVMITG